MNETESHGAIGGISLGVDKSIRLDMVFKL